MNRKITLMITVNITLSNKKVTTGKQKEKPSFLIKISPGSLPRNGMRPPKDMSNPSSTIMMPTMISIRPIPAKPSITKREVIPQLIVYSAGDRKAIWHALTSLDAISSPVIYLLWHLSFSS